MIETALIMNANGETMYWREGNDRTRSKIPDSNEMWEFIWDNQKEVYAIAHTHPHYGIPTPSVGLDMDVETFAGTEMGLGKRLVWPIVTIDKCVNFQYKDGKYQPSDIHFKIKEIDALRVKSGMKLKEEAT